MVGLCADIDRQFVAVDLGQSSGVRGPAAAVWSEFGANPRQFRLKGVASRVVGARQEMGAASWERPGNDQEQLHGDGDAVNSVAAVYPPPNDAMRSWLARGIHTFGIDPRRLGGRGNARQYSEKIAGQLPLLLGPDESSRQPFNDTRCTTH
jgi:hypothetical protein